ncbi:MAG: DUF1593 domain-containing protein [Clostridia bacterium]|nr:DUF1593 domain-containing protein [Clostridia bacterium]
MKNRYIVLTDINSAPEVDDIQSMYRLFLYANEIEIEGLIVNTSCFVKRISEKNRALILNVIESYEKVKENLDQFADYPSPQALRSVTAIGIPVYGRWAKIQFATKKYETNEGVRLLIRSFEKKDDRPLFIGLWAGANTLAQALWQCENTHAKSDFDALLGKLRIYSISDQDEASRWIRKRYGKNLFFIVSPSKGTWMGNLSYYRATWAGISSDRFKHGSEDGIRRTKGFSGADFSLIDNRWIRENVRSFPYAKGYPYPAYITEGDTPSFLWLIQNGLNLPEHPEYGGWGGRYARYLPDRRQFKVKEYYPIYTNVSDTVRGIDGNNHTSPQATIWRWRRDFQEDFYARLLWTIGKGDPLPSIQNEYNEIRVDRTVQLAVNGSFPNDTAFEWFVYRDISSFLPTLHANRSTCAVQIPANASGTAHVIVKIKTEHSPVRYARFLLKR